MYSAEEVSRKIRGRSPRLLSAGIYVQASLGARNTAQRLSKKGFVCAAQIARCWPLLTGPFPVLEYLRVSLERGLAKTLVGLSCLQAAHHGP